MHAGILCAICVLVGIPSVTMYARVLSTICVLLATSAVVQSRRWFASEVNCWVTQEKVPASWEDAQRRCERHGAVLASPLNKRLFDHMQSLINVQNHSVPYFLGTRVNRSADADAQDLQYVTVEGKRLDDMPREVYDAIEQLDLGLGDCLSMDRYGIRAVSCWDHLPYICYSKESSTECGSAPTTTQAPTTIKPPPAPTTTQAPTTIKPPPGYKFEAATGSSYKFYSESNGWDDAKTTCERDGAHLVIVNDAEEANIVAGIAKGAGIYYNGWAGLISNIVGGEKVWKTIQGEPLSSVFHVWHPLYTTRDLNRSCGGYMVIYKQLFDRKCNYGLPFICEISH